MATDGPKKIAGMRTDTGREVDAFGDGAQGLVGQRVQRGSKVKVTAKIIHDDGLPDLAGWNGRGEMPKAQRAAGHYVVVSVESQMKPGLECNGEILLNDSNAADMRRRVNILGGVLAERLCEKYGDQMDPGECAKAASEAWTDVMHAVEKL